MKIGILTFHRANNLGAVLQAFALQQTVKNVIASDVSIIDYNTGVFEERAKDINVFKRYAKNVYYKIKNYGFQKFRRKYLKLSKQYTRSDVVEANKYYDIIICGSDQIWNLGCSGNDYNYFLDFVADDVIKISYAASLGLHEFSEQEEHALYPILNKFKYISIREKNSLKNMKFISKHIDVVPDPVFLLEKEEWDEITPDRIVKGDYVLVYLIQEDVNVMNEARLYAKANNLRLISNKTSLNFMLHNSPEQFLSWIKHADCIFTNSFHGTALSLIFNKNFKADIQLRGNKINNRINDLLTEVKVKDAVIGGNCEVDYNVVNKEILRMREAGIRYLDRINNN